MLMKSLPNEHHSNEEQEAMARSVAKATHDSGSVVQSNQPKGVAANMRRYRRTRPEDQGHA